MRNNVGNFGFTPFKWIGPEEMVGGVFDCAERFPARANIIAAAVTWNIFILG